ncbi:MAG: HEAT repeat domain-containing protein [Gemmatimonadaceae bacterium]
MARAPDGAVFIEVASRPGACGDGREIVGFRKALFGRNFQTIGYWTNVRCVAGPLRVTLTVASGAVTQLHAQVGGFPASSGTRVTDLGSVAPAEASDYFFSLVPALEARGRSRKDRILLPAVLADAPVLQPLIAIARNDDRARHTRQHALQWLGLLGDETVLPTLMELAHDRDDGLSGAALMALSILDDEAGDRAARWLLERVADSREPLDLRKNALFWAGQREATPTADLVRAYRDAQTQGLREHAIFVLSQRKDDAATEELIRLAREEKDTEMRGKVLFWLAQKDDPRVRKLIADLILK